MDMAYDINKKSGALHVREGFSLIEIMIVIGIVGGIMAGVFTLIGTARSKAKRSKADGELLLLDTGINSYKMDTEKWPNVLKDLIKPPSDVKNFKGDYFPKKDIPLDPWDNKYQYKLTPDADKKYELYSYGPKGKQASKAERIYLNE